MRLSVVYNEDAGGGAPVDDLRRALEAAGHRVEVMLEARDGLTARLARRTELVVVAGGDGTIRRTVVELAGGPLPLAIVPLGTANNIATSLGLSGSFEEQIAGWLRGRRTPLDVGVARGPWGERTFLESAGTGLVAEGIAAMDAAAPHPEEGDREAMLAKARQRFLQVLRTLRPHPLRVEIDGDIVEREWLLLEVLNMRAIGPRLVLAGADPGDGRFDIAAAVADEREALGSCLGDSGHEARYRFRHGRLATRVLLKGVDVVHVDDWVQRGLRDATVDLVLHPAAVSVLVPGTGRGS